MDKKETALKYLSRDALQHVDMSEAIKRGLCSIDYAAPDGVKLSLEETVMLSCDSEETALRLISGSEEQHYLCLHQPEFAEALCSGRGYKIDNRCWTAAYLGEPFEELGEDVRILGMEQLDEVASMYALHDRAYLGWLIERKIMMGAFVDGQLAGFIGKHKEGAQGLLFVRPEYRRMGLAAALERRYINYDLSLGNIAYGHIIVGNTASRALQESLGLSFADKDVQWMTRA